LMSPCKLSIRRATSCREDVVGSVRICFTRIQIELFRSSSLLCYLAGTRSLGITYMQDTMNPSLLSVGVETAGDGGVVVEASARNQHL